MERDQHPEAIKTPRNAPPPETPQPRLPGKGPFGHLAAVVQFVGGAGLLFLVGIIVYEVVLRSFFDTSTDAAEEFAGYAVVLLTFFGACLTLREKALFQVRVLFKRLPEAIRRPLKLLYLVLSIGICSTLLTQAVKLVLSSYRRGNVAPTSMATPLWIPQLILLAGLALLILFLLEQIVTTLRSSSHSGGTD